MDQHRLTRSAPVRLFAPALSILLLAAVSGCANSGNAGGGGNDASAPTGSNGDMAMKPAGYCMADKDCTDASSSHCDVAHNHCVQCLADTDCDFGQVCNTANHTCTVGCNANHACAPDGGVCETDAGLCVQCNADSDCKDPMLPRCDSTGTHQCFACNPTNDNCGHGTFCAMQNGGYACTMGCKVDDDCNALPPAMDGGMNGGSDGGNAADGGGTDDGGNAADGGGNNAADGGNAGPADGGAADGGMMKAPQILYCNQSAHMCVECTKDEHCPLGRVCKANQCVPGCTLMHGCDNSLACCGQPNSMACTDTTSDFQNCGGCGVQCQGGWNCCNSGCSNPTIDVMNCGMCGNVCMVAHGTPTCVQRTCAIAKCDQGWADCVGGYLDGCETHTDVNVNNCGACNNVCTLPNAMPKCVGGSCQIQNCLSGWGDCNKMAADGCEDNITADINNCGGCGLACSSNHVQQLCKAGMCAGPCENGWGDCDMNKQTNGCEVDLNNDSKNCGACGNDCAVACNGNVASAACTKGVCGVTQCAPGYYDLDQQCANGCECKSAPAGGPVCAMAQDMGTLKPGDNPAAATGNMVGGVTDAWFKVTFVDDLAHSTYHPKVAFTTNPGNIFRFDVENSCMPNDDATTCPAPEQGTSAGRTAWEVYYAAPAMGPTYDQASPNFKPIQPVGQNGTVWVHVYSVNKPAPPTTCAALTYTIQFSNTP